MFFYGEFSWLKKRSFCKQNIPAILVVTLLPTPPLHTTHNASSVSGKSRYFVFVFFCVCCLLPVFVICSVWFGLVWFVDIFHVLLFANDMCAQCRKLWAIYAVARLTDINPLDCCDGIPCYFFPFSLLCMWFDWNELRIFYEKWSIQWKG